MLLFPSFLQHTSCFPHFPHSLFCIPPLDLSLLASYLDFHIISYINFYLSVMLPQKNSVVNTGMVHSHAHYDFIVTNVIFSRKFVRVITIPMTCQLFPTVPFPTHPSIMIDAFHNGKVKGFVYQYIVVHKLKCVSGVIGAFINLCI